GHPVVDARGEILVFEDDPLVERVTLQALTDLTDRLLDSFGRLQAGIMPFVLSSHHPLETMIANHHHLAGIELGLNVTNRPPRHDPHKVHEARQRVESRFRPLLDARIGRIVHQLAERSIEVKQQGRWPPCEDLCGASDCCGDVRDDWRTHRDPYPSRSYR